MKTFLPIFQQTICAFLLLMVYGFSNAQVTQPSSAAAQMTVANAPEKITTLIKIDEKIGTGAEATPGTFVEVHYTGWLYDPKAENRRGVKFDSSHDRKEPFTFQLGAQNVIRGWDLGVKGMKVGGKRTLIIPSYLAYGAQGNRVIPPNASLIFDVELVGIK